MVRGKELAQRTILWSFYNLKGAIAELEKEPPGAIRAMFLAVIPAELAPQGMAIMDRLPLPALAVLTAVFGSSFHQGYAKAHEHLQQGAPHLHQTLAARASAPARPPQQ